MAQRLNWHELKKAAESRSTEHPEALSARDYEHAVLVIAEYWELPQSAIYWIGTEIERLLPVIDRG